MFLGIWMDFKCCFWDRPSLSEMPKPPFSVLIRNSFAILHATSKALELVSWLLVMA